MNALNVIGSICLVLAVFLLIWRVNRLDRRMWTLEHRYCQQGLDGCACGSQDCIMGGPVHVCDGNNCCMGTPE